ncbi:sialidase family protein [Catenuloplanes atrovinosus]|uniref:Exo-alpha-sialidase n=1 Tax=Catenuloplanes atrovinosus TaxID=137266 RepID=A0AAE3YWN7_9ACTN|nr:sialidase family protein [Catenuloplanes atrovinosus]MDR7280157.1 hypothetical protein [Catenuloplanes atrovinosus]
MSKSRRLCALLVAAALVLSAALTARSVTDDEHHPSRVRRAAVGVPPGAVPRLAFVSQDVGYALYGCGGEQCPAPLFGTVDGGATWRRLAHPATGRVSLYASPRALVLWWSARDVSLMSTDRGVTWTEVERSLAPYRGIRGFFQAEDSGGLVSWRDGLPVRVPERPPLPFVSAVATGADGRVWVACLLSGGVRAAVSVDGGETWAVTPVVPQGGWPVSLSLRVSADGRNVWLLGHPSDPAAFPLLWTMVAGRWLPVAAAGHPHVFDSAVPVAGGLVVSGAAGSGLIAGGRYLPLRGWPPSDSGLYLLEDGTVFTQAGAVGWLGVGFGVDRRWTRIELRPA